MITFGKFHPIMLTAGILALGGCGTVRTLPELEACVPAEATDPVVPTAVPPTERGTAAMPRAVIYKTAGDFRDNVPVQVSADGKLISYPAPTDIPARATPVELRDGWLLSPLGVGSRSVFTSFTLDEYRALPSPPAPSEIMKALLPDGKVTSTLTLPMTPREAMTDTAAANRFIDSRSIPIPPARR